MVRAGALDDPIASCGDVLALAGRALALAFNHVRQWRIAAAVHDRSTQGNTPSVAAVLEGAECARRNLPEEFSTPLRERAVIILQGRALLGCGLVGGMTESESVKRASVYRLGLCAQSYQICQ